MSTLRNGLALRSKKRERKLFEGLSTCYEKSVAIETKYEIRIEVHFELERPRIEKSVVEMTYSKNSRVIKHLWRWFRFLCRFLNSQILHISTTKDDIFVDIVGSSEFLGGVATPSFCSVRDDLL